jgi:hypothetical protein
MGAESVRAGKRVGRWRGRRTGCTFRTPKVATSSIVGTSSTCVRCTTTRTEIMLNLGLYFLRFEGAGEGAEGVFKMLPPQQSQPLAEG